MFRHNVINGSRMLGQLLITVSTFPLPGFENVLPKLPPGELRSEYDKVNKEVVFAVEHGLSCTHDKNVWCTHLYFCYGGERMPE